MNLNDVRRQLESHCAFDAIEAQHVADTHAFVCAHPDNFWRRNNLVGHVTASAFVVNMEHSHALMLHHAALEKWLQPGGHVDDTDASPLEAALRETLEETGVTATPRAAASADPVSSSAGVLFDVDVHPIPARTKNGVDEPAHRHYDLRYLLVAAHEDVKLSAESFAFRWVALPTLADGRVESGIARMARKLISDN